MFTDVMEFRNEIEVVFPSQVEYSNIKPERLGLFLNEIKCQESNSTLLNDFFAVCKEVCSKGN